MAGALCPLSLSLVFAVGGENSQMIQPFEEDPAIAWVCLWDTVELDADRWAVGEAALPLLDFYPLCVFKSKRSQVEGRRVERGLDADRWAVGGTALLS